MGKKVSIITITYNSERTLEETIRSVANQDYPDIEYIIVDGASKDNTLNIVENYRNKISIVISEQDKGICDAFNKGIRAATGDIIGIINSDDMLTSGAISRLVQVMHDDSDILYGNGKRIYEDGHMEPYKSENHKELKSRMALVHPSTFIRKAAYEKYGYFDLQYKGCMDRELLLRMYTKGAIFQYDPFEYSIYRMGGFSDQQFKTVVSREREEISMKYGQPLVIAKAQSLITNMKFYIKNKLSH